MTWVLIAGLGWTVLGSGVAVVVGRAIRLADAHAASAPRTDGVQRLVLVGNARGPSPLREPGVPGPRQPTGRRSTRTPSR